MEALLTFSKRHIRSFSARGLEPCSDTWPGRREPPWGGVGSKTKQGCTRPWCGRRGPDRQPNALENELVDHGATEAAVVALLWP